MSEIDRSFQKIEQKSFCSDVKNRKLAVIHIIDKHTGYVVVIFIYGTDATTKRFKIKKIEEIGEVQEYLKKEKVNLIEIIFYDDSENNERYRFKEINITELKSILEFRLFGIYPPWK